MFNRYKAYFEAWLNIPIGQIEQASGIIVLPTETRIPKADGWPLKLPVCAFEMNHAVLISCTPELESELRHLLYGSSVTEAIQKMQKYFKDEKNLATEYHKNYGLGELNSQIATSDSIMLNDSLYEQYVSFYKKIHGSLYEIMTAEPEWLPQHFNDVVNRKACFCLLRDNEIVSATESETIPNKPDGIIDLGINTLSKHRKNGYASIVCAAFIKYYQQKNILPLWECAFNNYASEKLALKLGFKYMGNMFYVVSF